MNRYIQALTSDSGGGSYAQSKTHNDVRHDLTVADCKALASTLRRDLIRPLCIFNFGEDKRIPKIQFDCEEGAKAFLKLPAPRLTAASASRSICAWVPGPDPHFGQRRRQLRPEQDPQRRPARPDRG